MKLRFAHLARFIARKPWTVIALTLAVTALLGAGMARLTVDADMTDDIPDTVPEKAFYDEVGRIFPSDDFLIVALTDSRGVFSPGMLRQVYEWSESLSLVDGVKNVISLSTAGLIRGTAEGLVIEDAMPTVPETPEEIEAFRSRVAANSMTESLIGKDGKSTSLLLTLREGLDSESVNRVEITLPKGEAADEAFTAALTAASVETADGPVPAVLRAYLPESEADTRDARARFGARIRADGKGASVVLAELAPGADSGKAGAAVIALAKERGWKARLVSSKITGYERVTRALEGLPVYTDGKVYVSGSKAVSSIVSKLLITDLGLLFPVVVLVIVVILFLSFRTARGVLFPLGNVILSVVWAMGLMGILGQPISMATMVLPIILIAVGTAYTIHVINRYYEDLVSISDKVQAVESTVKHVAKPVFLAGATTVIGFASLAVSSLAALRMFGILSALGILFALALSLTLTPAVLSLLPKPKATAVRAHDESRLASTLAAAGRFVANRPWFVLIACLAAIVGIGAFAPGVSFESNTLNSFKRGSEIRRASEYLNDNFTGITVMTVVVRTDEDGAVLDPAVLRAMDGLQSRLELLRLSGKRIVESGEAGYEEGLPIVGGSQSIVTFVKGINKALNADDPAFDKVPDDVTPVPVTTERYLWRAGDRRLEERDSETNELLATYAEGSGLGVEGGTAYIDVQGARRRVDLATGTAEDLIPGRDYAGQLVFQYENSGKPENIEGFLDNPRRTARINVFLKTSSSTLLGQIQDKARSYIAQEFPEGSRADITGLSNLTMAIMRLLVSSQISSVLASLVVCFLFIALMSRSFAEGFFSIIPLSASLIINFGTMAIFGIPIDISTATIASIGIGIGIDYVCHFLERLKFCLCTLNLQEAIEETMRTTGKGIFVNALAVAGGFAALLFSQLRGNVFMGLLMALIMLTSSFFSVTLFPALLVLVKPKFLTKGALASRCEDETAATLSE